MLFACSMTYCARHRFRAMLMGGDIGDLFVVARRAWLDRAQRDYEKRPKREFHIRFTSFLGIAATVVCPESPIASFNSAVSIQSTRSTPG